MFCLQEFAWFMLKLEGSDRGIGLIGLNNVVGLVLLSCGRFMVFYHGLYAYV